MNVTPKTAQEHADKILDWLATDPRAEVDSGAWDGWNNAAAAFDALLAEVERLTAERDAISAARHRWQVRAEVAERERDEAQELRERDRHHHEHVYSAMVADRDDWKARHQAAEARHQEFLRDMDIPVVKDGITYAEACEALQAAEALAERREAERDDLLHALQEIWDDWCSGHMGDCSCIVCSLTADALNIDRAALADEGQA